VAVSSLSGSARRESPMRKCPGVKTDMSEGSVERGVKGREFNIASIRTKTVFDFSKVSDALPNVLYKCVFNDFTAASHKPPKCGERGGIKCHCMPCFAISSLTLF